MQEGKVQGVTGCSPSGFRQVKVAVCGPYLLGFEMGPCNMAVLKPHPAAHHPAFALRCGSEAPLSVLVAVCSLLRQVWLLCVWQAPSAQRPPHLGQMALRPWSGSAAITTAPAWAGFDPGGFGVSWQGLLLLNL